MLVKVNEEGDDLRDREEFLVKKVIHRKVQGNEPSGECVYNRLSKAIEFYWMRLSNQFHFGKN